MRTRDCCHHILTILIEARRCSIPPWRVSASRPLIECGMIRPRKRALGCMGTLQRFTSRASQSDGSEETDEDLITQGIVGDIVVRTREFQQLSPYAFPEQAPARRIIARKWSSEELATLQLAINAVGNSYEYLRIQLHIPTRTHASIARKIEQLYAYQRISSIDGHFSILL